MTTPLLDHEVLRLNNSNYMKLLLATFQHLKSVSTTNYSDLFDKTDASIHIEDRSKDRLQFKFRSDNVLSCSGSFTFKQGKLDSFTYAIKPASYFKKRITRKQYQRIVAMFTKISESIGADVEPLSNEMMKFHFNEGTLTVMGGQHIITGTPMVTILFDK